MKLRKKLVTVLMTVGITASLFTGCSTKDVMAVRTETAEEAINLFNKYNKENDIENMVALYSDVYLDSVGYSSGEVVKLLKNNRKDIEITKSETESIETINGSIEKAVVNMAFMEDENETPYTYNYALIKEEEGWAVSPDGVINCTNVDVPQKTSKELNLDLSKIIELLDGCILRINVINDTSLAYMFGGTENPCEVVVETTEGTYRTSMSEAVQLDKNIQTYFMARFDDLEGTIKKITLTNIYDVEDNNIKDNTVRDIVIYEE